MPPTDRVARAVTRLVELGVPELAGVTTARFTSLAADLPGGQSTTLVVHPSLVPASRLVPLLQHAGKPGFVVHDMDDLDEFVDIDCLDVPEPNHCFMTIGSRKPKGRGWDSRTPALWISGGTGHDGPGNKSAPKLGWCWAGNRHTWLGFASTTGRTG